MGATIKIGDAYELVLGGAHTTNPLQWLLFYTEEDTNNAGSYSSHGVSNGATPVTLLALLEQGSQTVEGLVVHNADTVTQTVTIRYSFGGTTRIQVKATLATLDTLYYEQGKGWYCLDSNGKLKVQTAAGGAGGDSVSINGVAATDADLNDTTPAAPGGDLNIKFQRSGTGPDSVSGYVDVSVLEPLVAIGNIAGTLAIGKGGTGQTSAAAAFNALSPLTTQGDTLYRDGSGNTRLAKGTAYQRLRMNVTPDAPEWSDEMVNLNFIIDGGGSAITTGKKGHIVLDFACTITGWTILADQSGSIVVDVNKAAYSGFPTTASIAGSELPTLSAAEKNEDLTLSTWTTALAARDILEFEVDSASTVTRVTVSIRVKKH